MFCISLDLKQVLLFEILILITSFIKIILLKIRYQKITMKFVINEIKYTVKIHSCNDYLFFKCSF